MAMEVGMALGTWSKYSWGVTPTAAAAMTMARVGPVGGWIVPLGKMVVKEGGGGGHALGEGGYGY